MTLTVLSTGQVFHRSPLKWDLLSVLTVKAGAMFQERKEVECVPVTLCQVHCEQG